MGGVRVLVGTRKGAFVLTSDEGRRRWEVQGPHFAGWEIYHLAGSPADPDRVWASQSSSWFGRDAGTGRRRPFVRFFACGEDLSHAPLDAPLPDAVLAGTEPLLVVGAMAGG